MEMSHRPEIVYESYSQRGNGTMAFALYSVY